MKTEHRPPVRSDASRLIVLVGLAIATVACNERAAEPVATVNPAPAAVPAEVAAPVPANPVRDRILAARTAVAIGNRQEAEKLMQAMSPDELRAARIPDPKRPIDPDKVSALVKAMEGVESVVWLDKANMVVQLASAALVKTTLIDRICLDIEPLGDNLAVVVNLQDVGVPNIDEMTTLSRNCGLAEGQRALILR